MNEHFHSNIIPDIISFTKEPFPYQFSERTLRQYSQGAPFRHRKTIRGWVEKIFVKNGHDKFLELNTTVEKAVKEGDESLGWPSMTNDFLEELYTASTFEAPISLRESVSSSQAGLFLPTKSSTRFSRKRSTLFMHPSVGEPIPAFGWAPFKHPLVSVKKQISRLDPLTGKVSFADGTELNDVDHIVFGTGYTFSLPWIPYVQECISKAYRRLPGVYQHTWDIEDPTLTFVGMCSCLQSLYGEDAVDLRGDPAYANFTGSFWSELQEEINPCCIFYPSSPSAVSVLILLSRQTQCPFAVKSGGHAAFAGASSIEGGITVSLKNLNSIELSADNSTAFIQPGNTWGHIYTELAKYDLSVIGGRVTDIGIGGLTTGGGISFFSNIYGWACDNVASYVVVTATGNMVTASASQHSDLYWALRGGGNNFGIVVEFELETIPLPRGEMWGGTRVYTEDEFPNVIDAFVGLIDDSPSDPNAGTWLAWILNDGAKLAGSELWYAKPNGQNATIFSKYNNITAVSDDTQNRVLANYTDHVAESNPYGYRECYYAISVKGCRVVAQVAADSFFNEVVAVENVTGANPVMVWQGITKGQLEGMKKNGGNTLGLSVEDGPFYLMVISAWWEDEEDDAAMYRMISAVLEKIKAAAVSEGVQNDYVYMNYASQFQDVVSSYGPENKAALKRIATKYDPAGVFQRLQPGYFKLDRAPVPDSGYFSF
ncbi:hypothetical protein diail_10923 [Diaporthe ilicicola]|nr:hypothetical protein diail_10923 [Diaporthe ilicicola]